jgi:hypothetical protein
VNARWWLKRVGWLTFPIVVGLFVWAPWRTGTASREVRLKDSSILRLESIRFKPRSANSLGQRWMQKARMFIAQSMHRPFLNDAFAPPGSLVYWVSRHDAETGKTLPINPASSAMAVDSHGCEFSVEGLGIRPAGWLRPIGPPAGGGASLFGGWVPVFPRRDRLIRLRFQQMEQIIGELTVPNPAFRHYPDWKPEPLPATRSLGTGQVTLLDFDNAWGTGQFPSSYMQFTLTPQFALPPEWELESVMVEDATGNCGAPDWSPQFGPSPRTFPRLRPWEAVSTRFALCTNESAWKLSARFIRRIEANFALNEVWTIPTLRAPNDGILVPLTASNTWQGVTVRLCAIAGPGEVTYSNGVPVQIVGYKSRKVRAAFGGPPVLPGPHLIPVASERPQLLIQVTGLQDGMRLTVVTRKARKTRSCPQRMGCNDYQVLALDSAEPNSAIDLCVIVQHPETVEFLVQPKARIDDSPAGWTRPRLRQIPDRVGPRGVPGTD